MSSAHKNAGKCFWQKPSWNTTLGKNSSIIQILVLILSEFSWFRVTECVANWSFDKSIFSLTSLSNVKDISPSAPLKDLNNVWPTFSQIQGIINPFNLCRITDGYVLSFGYLTHSCNTYLLRTYHLPDSVLRYWGLGTEQDRTLASDRGKGYLEGL